MSENEIIIKLLSTLLEGAKLYFSIDVNDEEINTYLKKVDDVLKLTVENKEINYE